MRLWFIAAIGGFLLWGLIRLSRTYTYEWDVVVVGPGIGYDYARLVAVGSGYAFLQANLPDTLSLARLCKGLGSGGALSIHSLHAPLIDSLCQAIQRQVYRPRLRWILPEGCDFAMPYRWKVDSVWALTGWPPPPVEIDVVGRKGQHRYPIPLPKSLGVYPETLWVEAKLVRYFRVRYMVEPRILNKGASRVFLTPPRLTLEFEVEESHKSRVQPRDFDLVVDMNKVLPGDSVVSVALMQKPAGVRNVRFFPTALRFIEYHEGGRHYRRHREWQKLYSLGICSARLSYL